MAEDGVDQAIRGRKTAVAGTPRTTRLAVVRGGAFWNNPTNMRCAYRNRNDPNNRNDNIGFRVVLSTLLST
jgi:formylglycine-generating enzyme required for sulfatase activity